MPKTIAIAGGGASGLAAAVAAKQASPKTQVLLLERGDRVGRKILATGNGRCNLTNLAASPERYSGTDLRPAASLLRRYSPETVLAFFEDLGLLTRAEDEGRVYPASGQASAVLDVLRLACARLGVEERCGWEVRSISPEKRGFTLTPAQGAPLVAQKVILAAGGMAAPNFGTDGSGFSLLRALGHKIEAPYPALVQLRTGTSPIRGLKGVRIKALIRSFANRSLVRQEEGELLFTEYGLSGIPALQASLALGPCLQAGGAAEVSLHLFPQWEDLPAMLAAQAARRRGLPAGQLFTGLLHKRLSALVLERAGVSGNTPCDALGRRALSALSSVCGDFRLNVTGTQGFPSAQVTGGGAALSQFDPRTLESRLHPGLYAAGEVLDVTGECGGFNLHWAWASGLAAGEAAGRTLS